VKKLLFYVILAGCFLASIANAGVSIDGNNDDLEYNSWLPKKAYIAFNQQNGIISSYRVAFQADGGELFNHWKLKNSDDYEIPFPFVLESTLIIDDKNEVERTSNWGFGRLDGNNDNAPSAYLDSTFGNMTDGDDKYGIGILGPSQLQGDVIYDHWVGLEPGSVTPKDCRTLAVKLRFRLNIDLSEAKKFGYAKSTIEDDFVLGDGWEGTPGTPFGYDAVDTNQNYSAQNIGDYFSFAIEDRKGDNHPTYSDYFNLSGMEGQWCKKRQNGEDEELPYRVNSLEECFGLDAGGGSEAGTGTDEDPEIYTEVNHTHVIAPNYRCSKETNGPILCWEAGGSTNCWDANEWYQFNGEISEVANHYNDFDWITIKNRLMCAEVYNDNSGNSHGGTWQPGGPYPGDPIYGNDPFVPNADVSIKYLEIKGPGQSNHHTESGAIFYPGQTQSVDLKGKIKNKSNDNTDMARIQYCATTKKKFRHDERIWVDEDYLDSHEREHDFDPGETITKHGQAFITLATDLSSITVFKGDRSHTFPITEKHLYEKKIPIYFWVDTKVEVDDDEDYDVSCSVGSSCGDEYAKFEVLLPWFNSQFSLSAIGGEAPLTVAFTNNSQTGNGATISHNWDLGDGTISTEVNPVHLYTEAGTYEVILTTTSNWGEVRTSLAAVIVTEPEVVIDPEDYCHETVEMLTNGGWGWNPVGGYGCVPESQNFCHSNNDGTIYGWNPYTQTSCDLNKETEGDGNGNTQNLIQNSDFSNGWNNWIDATWNVTSAIDIFDNRAVITITDNSNGGDAKLFHNEIAVTAGNYTFGATITNDVEVTAMLLLKKTDGSEDWSWAGVISPSAEEQTVTFNKTISADVTTARVIMSIKDIGTLGIDDYFLIKELSSNTQNLVQNSDFSNGWDNWIDATWNVTSAIDIFDNRAVITITDNSNGGDAKLFHNEIAVTAGNYTFGATITNDVEVTAMLLLKKADGSEEWSWAGVIAPSTEEQTVTFNKTISADVTTARVIMSIKDIGTLGIDDYFLIKE
jgi:PKD repeat protein